MNSLPALKRDAIMVMSMRKMCGVQEVLLIASAAQATRRELSKLGRASGL